MTNVFQVSVHPSSVNFQVRYYESPYLVYHEKVKTSKVSSVDTLIRENTIIVKMFELISQASIFRFSIHFPMI